MNFTAYSCSISKIAGIEVEGNGEFTNTVAVGANITIEMTIKDEQNQELVNATKVGYIFAKVIRLPPAYYGGLFDSDEENIITVDGNLKETGDNGTVSSSFTIQLGKVGYYVISFQFGTTFSIPVTFYTDFPLQSVVVTQSPDYNTSYTPDTTVFGTMPVTKDLECQITSTTANKSGYVVGYGVYVEKSPAVYQTGAVATNQRSYDEKTSNTPNWITFQIGQNVQETNSSGYAVFDKATILDGNTDYEKTKFFCYVGDNVKNGNTNYFLTSTNYSDDVVFYSSDMFTLMDGYSNFISANQPFIDPPVIKVTVDNQYMKEYSVSAQIIEFDYKTPSNPELFTQRYMSGYICKLIFPDNSGSGGGKPNNPTTNDGCSAEILTDKGDTPMVFEISFNNLMFTKNGIEKFIRLSFASPQ